MRLTCKPFVALRLDDANYDEDDDEEEEEKDEHYDE